MIAAQADVVARTELRSRDEAERLLARVSDTFERAKEHAADTRDRDNYRALVVLHAAVTRHLQVSIRPLPRIVRYSFPASMPVLSLANRIYGDASRSAELIQENRRASAHPLFMPADGRALSK